MAHFRIVLGDRSVEAVGDADTYQQEGPMTTFFRLGAGRGAVDCWATRVASFRTADLVAVRRIEGEGTSRASLAAPRLRGGQVRQAVGT